ncbi:hypothetical protein PPTG_19567 [Phytophthora nicotianae INRA-310]|uniref:RxLR effector protein n=1 Tax=Phytophthora nicotianae (strain INRA-310) TaxID=761204 RepID=W2PEM0_PHYN3|nr:hypothetical protein PPTG_19567 [Phytophthora nicotianae INRA-310]ETM98444.1 hypothetical protein PPTG_19567 [Phytophthora nicotianae INRA-310]
MRLTFILLLIASAFVSSVSALPVAAGAETRSLRSAMSTVDDHVAGEERGGFTYNFNFGIFERLPSQFKRMKKEPEHLRSIFNSWKSGMRSSDEAAAYMRSQGMSEDAIEQFTNAYKAYLSHQG